MRLLQNKSTGEIGCLVCSFGKTPEKITVVEYIDGKRGSKVWYYNSLAELNEEWCDYEEPKEYWYIDPMVCGVYFTKIKNDEDLCEFNKQIGNYFETKEEAELAVRKLKAWKRLKDKGFKIANWEFRDVLDGDLVIEAKLNFDNTSSIQRDLEVCFGGEE